MKEGIWIEMSIKKTKEKKKNKQELDCKFIRINPDEKNFDSGKYLNEIKSYITKPTIELTKKDLKIDRKRD